jgi:hypothetical protein
MVKKMGCIRLGSWLAGHRTHPKFTREELWPFLFGFHPGFPFEIRLTEKMGKGRASECV